eukprot:scaffold4439_cov22-Tisochrysis_lutea.AAC.1
MLPYLVYLLAHHPDFPEQGGNCMLIECMGSLFSMVESIEDFKDGSAAATSEDATNEDDDHDGCGGVCRMFQFKQKMPVVPASSSLEDSIS